MHSQLGSVGWQLERAARGTLRMGDECARQAMLRGRGVWWRLPWPLEVRESGAAGGSRVRDERMRRLEAVLFLAREPLSSRKLSQYANLADATEARTLIRRLNQLYDQGGRAFRVEEVANGFQLLTRPQFAVWLRRLDGVPREIRQSAPALETLAVVAYRQPIGRAGVEAIRGVSCGEILRQLMERDLVRIRGRSEELGRPYLYGTTKRFLQLFGLKSLDFLPKVADLRGGHEGEGAQLQMGAHEGVSQQVGSAERDREKEEESEVTATLFPGLSSDELSKRRLAHSPLMVPRCSDEEEDDFEEDEELDDEEYDEDEYDEDFEDEDEDFEDEWEEVEDEDEEEEDEDDEEDDWEDEEDDEEDEEEEEGEGDWE